MFNSKHYIPILKWKRAELRALKGLSEKDRDQITPLIELVMPMVPIYKDPKKKIKKSQAEMLEEIVAKFKTKRITEIPKEILASWGKRPIFVDFSLLYNTESATQIKIYALHKIITAGVDLGLKIIPLLNLSDDHELKRAICSVSKEYDQGICLRITPSDLSDTEKVEALSKKIDGFLSDFDLNEKNIDLLIDIKEQCDQYLKCLHSSQNIKNLTKWRNFIFACGAFPANLSKCKLDEPTLLPRIDWKNWLKYTRDKAKDNKLSRVPIFADYAIRNPIFNESLQYFSSTTSIKYTIDNDWVIMKGKIRDYPLYLVNAKLLVEDTEYFYGEAFSSGDEYVAQKAKHYHEYIKNPSIKGTGRSEDWIAMGTNHHLALVVHQIANLA
ncbi:beta family protein [Patescibacteria group bacterium]|nr:beta family protein [Patescibacteria group bacterium]